MLCVNFGVLNKSLNEFVEQDCELLRRRDLQNVDALLKTKKGDKGGDGLRIFDKLKKTLNSQPELKEEYEKKITAARILPDTREEVNFLMDLLISKYKSQLTGYINNSDSKSLKLLQDALKKANKSPQSMSDRLGVFNKLLPCMVDRCVLDSLKLLSKNGIACFNATCLNVVLRELLVRYVQFKSDPSSLAFTEDENEFYQKMIILENNTASWLENAIYQVNSNPQTSKPIKLDTEDPHIPKDEPSRLHQFSFILLVLQALGCSAQQVNIRVGMVFEGEILVNSRERRYTQTTEVKRGALSNNRWKLYEFLYPNADSNEGKDRGADHLDESKRPSANNKREDGFNNQEKTKQNKTPSPNRVERSYSKDDWQECLSLLLTSDSDKINNIITLVDNDIDYYSICSLDNLLQEHQTDPKDLAGPKRSFHEISTEEEEESTYMQVETSPIEENSSPPPKRFCEHNDTECLYQGENLSLSPLTSFQFTDAQCRVIKQDRDGHCLFHSMSYYYPSEYNNGLSLREKICAFLAENKELHINDTSLKDWVFMSRLNGQEDDEEDEENDAIKEAYFEEYLTKMRGKSYGGDIELRIFSHIKQINIHIYKRKNRGYERIANFDCYGSRTTIRLLFSKRIKHYDVLLLR